MSSPPPSPSRLLQVIGAYLILAVLVVFWTVPRSVTVTFGAAGSPPHQLHDIGLLLMAYASIGLLLLLASATFERPRGRVLFDLACLLSLPAATFLVTVISFICYTIARLGRIPLPLHPSAQSIGLSMPLFAFSWLVFLGCFLAGYVKLSCRFDALKRSRWANLGAVLACFSCWLLLALFVTRSGMRFFDWLAD